MAGSTAMYDVASSTARVSAFAFSARARSSAATASMAGEIRERSASVSATCDGAGGRLGHRVGHPHERSDRDTRAHSDSVQQRHDDLGLPDGSVPVLLDVSGCLSRIGRPIRPYWRGRWT